MNSSARSLVGGLVLLAGIGATTKATAQTSFAGDAAKGKLFFSQACAICHANNLGAGNTVIVRRGPDLIGVAGRAAATGLSFNYTKALRDSGFTWDDATLDRFLANPAKAVPGTTMPIPLQDADIRHNVIAYLDTLTLPPGVTPVAAAAAAVTPYQDDPGDWRNAAPGVKHHITVADLPPPFSTASAGNGPHGAKKPADAVLSVPPGFAVKLFASGLSGPRLVRVAPNGDIFVVETRENRVRVLRAADGADAPSTNEVFATGLNGPFGIAFYPLGNDPQWLYVANNNSVVRFPYHNGDLQASGTAQTIVPHLCDSGGGHSTRDVAFSPDGQRLFISVGSGSNVAEGMGKKNPDAIKQWEAEHGRGAAWDAEANRADVFVTDPEGHQPLKAFATGIRNSVTLAINPTTGDLWTAVNERDGLGDNLVPDYITRVKEGGFYGWPWYYMGNFEDPRHAGERPDLKGVAIVPDVLLQSHSAPLEMTFYTVTNGVSAFPTEYIGDIFACSHGSWNRSNRTGYKVIRARLENGIPTGEYDDFLTGFVVDEHSVWGRPVGVAAAHDGSLLITDDEGGTIWRVSYTAQ